MKKTLFFAAMMVAAMSSCNMEPEFPVDDNTGEVPAAAFTATTESAGTRTSLSGSDSEGFEVLWSSGDAITIVDAASNVGVYATTSTGSHGVFTKTGGEEATVAGYSAYYPSTIYNGGTPALPAESEYAENNISAAPMYAASSTRSLDFKNLCGIVRLNVSTTRSGKKVSSISLKADQGMSGPFTVSDNAAVVSGTGGVTLNCPEAVAIGGTATQFMFAVPAGTYTNLKITVVAEDGSAQTRTSKKGIVINRSSITDISLNFGNLSATSGSAEAIGGARQWVQLWPGGPKWAKFNIGSTIDSYAGKTEYTHPDVIGGYYSYRGRKDGTNDAGGTEDTATYVWGSNWQTPTRDQQQALLDNCTWEWCDGATVQYEAGCTLAGWKVSGKEAGYEGNSIFLPLAGAIDQSYSYIGTLGTRGVYWSGTSGGSGAYFLEMTSGGRSIPTHNTPHKCSVRAICVDDKEFIALSSTATANCYIIPGPGTYCFKATEKGNGAADLAGVSAHTAASEIASAGIVWASFGTLTAPTAGQMFDNLVYANGYVYFSVPDAFVEGNAIVAIKNASGTILWSWHLWFTDDDLESGKQTYPGGAIFMDRNLGALAAGYDASNTADYGLLYQWGRKDPFLNVSIPGFNNAVLNEKSPTAYIPALLGTQETRVAVYRSYGVTDIAQMPQAFINQTLDVANNNASDYNSWAGDMTDNLWAAEKTIFDPCPAGWKVPGKNAWDSSFRTAFTAASYAETDNSFTVSGIRYPSTGYRMPRSYGHNKYGSYTKMYSGNGMLDRSKYYHVFVWAYDGFLLNELFLYEGTPINAPGVYDYSSMGQGNNTQRTRGGSVRCVKE